MVDATSLVYGALVTLAIYVLLKTIDIILEHVLNQTLFSRVWKAITKSIKKFKTRLNPIAMSFQFSVKIEPNEPTDVKENLIKLISHLSEKHKGNITFSTPKWTDTDKTGSVNVTFNNREFSIDMDISSEYRDFEPEEEIFKAPETSEISDSIVFSIKVRFPFKSIEPMLLSLSSLTNFISEQLRETLAVVRFSKGLFTIAPSKADFTMNHWIKEKQFDVSLLLKARENILVNLYPKKAEIVFPTLQIDEKVSEYLEATILNYYL